jgi:hypothetical protein
MTNNFRRNRLAMLFAGMLATTSVLVVGCSKDQPRTATSNPSPTMALPAESAVAPPAPVQPPVEKKKVRKRRPSTVTYTDPTYGVSFRYPRKYTLKNGDDAQVELAELGPVPLNFVQPGGVTVVSVEMPEGSYPKTDFTSAILNLNVNRSMTAEECSQFSLANSADPDHPVQPSKVKVGEREFDEMEAIAEQGKAQADARYYHVFQDGACYEFALALGTADSTDMEAVSPVDRDTVFAKLEKILSTVKIESKPAAEIAAKPAMPDSENQ